MKNLSLNKRYYSLFLASHLLTGTAFAASSGDSRISDKVTPPQLVTVERTEPLLEFGDKFLNTGSISSGFELPTGAVWKPEFLLWGNFRTALQHFDDGTNVDKEWANRLDLFAQLKLSGTERFLISTRPLDENGEFTGRRYGDNEGSVKAYNNEVRTAFFEGEFGEIFPKLDKKDKIPLDYGFSIGRQPISKQDGMLISDNIDALGVVKNSIQFPGSSNLRVSGIYGWNEIHRNDNTEDEQARMLGVFSEVDFPRSTVDLDLVYVDSDSSAGDGYYLGVNSVQRFGHINSNFRYLYSHAKNGDSDAVSSGSLFFSELSMTPAKTHDNVYFNSFVGINKFASVARDTSAGGPLGRTGILFSSTNLGNYSAPLSNRPDDAYGASLGYQKVMSDGRKQIVLETAFREETEGVESGARAIGLRYQQALGKHSIFRVDAFSGKDQSTGNIGGLRTELQYKF